MELSALREEINKLPFEAFMLRLSDGSNVSVPHRDFIAIAPPRNVFVSREEGGYELLDVLHIVAIGRTPSAARRRRSKGGDGR